MDPIFSSGDTAWMLISTALVILMTIPGLALFYGGLIRRENVLNTLFLSFITFSIVSVLWFIYGYDLAF
ncbi:MAG: ammonia channel protein, partial [Methanobacteriales archaeon HGW-Methanobacteriales-2]